MVPYQVGQKLVLIWIQTVWHSDGVPERIFRKKKMIKKSDCKIIQHAKRK